MYVAYQKKKENICEYFLYMFQIEDLIRACKFDKKLIESQLLTKYPSDMAIQSEVSQWYLGLANQMEEEHLHTSGHLITIKNKIAEVFDFHLYLMNNLKEIAYQSKFAVVAPLLAELRQRQSATNDNDLMLALNSVYGFLILKLKGSQITKSTAEAMKVIVEWFNLLSAKFKAYESGELKLDL